MAREGEERMAREGEERMARRGVTRDVVNDPNTQTETTRRKVRCRGGRERKESRKGSERHYDSLSFQSATVEKGCTGGRTVIHPVVAR